jgi:hypothetical protein
MAVPKTDETSVSIEAVFSLQPADEVGSCVVKGIIDAAGNPPRHQIVRILESRSPRRSSMFQAYCEFDVHGGFEGVARQFPCTLECVTVAYEERAPRANTGR